MDLELALCGVVSGVRGPASPRMWRAFSPGFCGKGGQFAKTALLWIGFGRRAPRSDFSGGYDDVFCPPP